MLVLNHLKKWCSLHVYVTKNAQMSTKYRLIWIDLLWNANAVVFIGYCWHGAILAVIDWQPEGGFVFTWPRYFNQSDGMRKRLFRLLWWWGRRQDVWQWCRRFNGFWWSLVDLRAIAIAAESEKKFQLICVGKWLAQTSFIEKKKQFFSNVTIWFSIELTKIISIFRPTHTNHHLQYTVDMTRNKSIRDEIYARQQSWPVHW